MLCNWCAKSCDRSFLATYNFVVKHIAWCSALLYTLRVTQPRCCWSTEMNSCLLYCQWYFDTWNTDIESTHFSIILFTILQQGKLCATIYNLILSKIIVIELGNALMAIEHLWSLILSLNDTVLLLASENSSNPATIVFLCILSNAASILQKVIGSKVMGSSSEEECVLH